MAIKNAGGDDEGFMNRMLPVLLCSWSVVAVGVAFSAKPGAVEPTGRRGSPQGSGQSQGQGPVTASVWGTVRDAAGKPVEGAVVSIRAADQTFSTSVFTDDNGEYVMPPL